MYQRKISKKSSTTLTVHDSLYFVNLINTSQPSAWWENEEKKEIYSSGVNFTVKKSFKDYWFRKFLSFL